MQPARHARNNNQVLSCRLQIIKLFFSKMQRRTHFSRSVYGQKGVQPIFLKNQLKIGLFHEIEFSRLHFFNQKSHDSCRSRDRDRLKSKILDSSPTLCYLMMRSTIISSLSSKSVLTETNCFRQS